MQTSSGNKTVSGDKTVSGNETGMSSISVSGNETGMSSNNTVHGVGGGGNVGAVGVDGSSNGLLDDGLTLDGDGVGNGIRSINVDGGGDLNDLFSVDGDVIGDLNTSLNIDRLVHGVHLDLFLDDGSTNTLGATEDGGHLDGEMGGGGLVDGCSITGHIAGLSKVDLLRDNRGGLVEGGDALSLGVHRVGGGQRHSGGGSGYGNCGGSSNSGHRGSGSIAMSGKEPMSGNETMSGQETSMSNQGSGWGAEGGGDNAKCNKSPHFCRSVR